MLRMGIRVLTSFLFCFASVHSNSAELVKFGFFELEYPPFHRKVGDEFIGPDKDVILEIFRRMDDYQLELTPVPIGRAFAEFKAGRVDAMYSYKTPKRYAYTLYSHQPIRQIQFFLVVMSGKTFTLESYQDLKGKSIGLLEHGVVDPGLLAAQQRGELTIYRVPSIRALMKMMARGRIDAVFGNPILLLNQAQDQKMDVEVLPAPLGPKRGFHIAISTKAQVKSHQNLREQISKVVAEMNNDGFIDQILQKNNVEQVIAKQPPLQ